MGLQLALILILGSYTPWILDGEDWRKATGAEGKLAKHDKSDPHKAAAADYAARTTEEQSSVGVHLSQAYADKLKSEAEEKARNRSILYTIVDIIRFFSETEY